MLTVLSLCLSTDFLFYPQIITEDNLVGDFHRFLSYPQISQISGAFLKICVNPNLIISV